MALGEPRYVSRIDPLTNTITLGRREDLETTTIELERASFVAGDAPGGRRAVPGRHPDPSSRDADRGDRRPATPTEPARGGRWLVETDTPVWAAAPGQAAVLYDGDVVIGGGRIARPATGRPGARRATAIAHPGEAAMSIDPALILSVAGRDLPRVAVRAHPWQRRRAPADHRRGRDPRGVGR